MNNQFDLRIPSFKLWKSSEKNISKNNIGSCEMFSVSKKDTYGNHNGDILNVIHSPTSPTNRILRNETRFFPVSNKLPTMSLDMESPFLDYNNLSNQDVIPYNYMPFFGNRLVSQSKIDALRETEVTEHCLIFHEDVEHDIDFRPDLCLNCGNTKYNHNIYNTNKNNRNDRANGDRMTNYLNNIEKRYRLKKEPQKITKARHSSNLSINTCEVLENFWKGSDLLNSLDPNYLEMLSAIARNELEEIYKAQLLLNYENGSSLDLDMSKSSRLRRNYQRALSKASCIQKPLK